NSTVAKEPAWSANLPAIKPMFSGEVASGFPLRLAAIFPFPYAAETSSSESEGSFCILIEGERIKAVSDGFIDPPPGGELVDLRKKFVLPGLIDCHVHLTAQLDQGYRLRTVEDSDPKVAFNAAHNAAITLAA